ncbi:MAG: ATP-binding protein [Atopobiaceae bacterium]|jgi:ATP-dependent Clp protease adapter protein ClpS|nr:ATP-binding protein [Atopobiaceae bacterium]MCH4180834.1 ATP-binding protein [Atopobiaceae bacterium]MCH4214123.1 ATP-binding protein [Atopobiaceae bacterium]MCH4229703.1 ATP-binding protein [Atopobiaceae bacterium]MCH4276475.1 ATP-binding protein [Atopobiaceae bacterium]
MATTFYPFVENNDGAPSSQDPTDLEVRYPARIAVYDDPMAAPRVVIVAPTDVHSFLEEITKQVTQLSHEQGGTIPFMVIREVAENYIHAYFIEPTINILTGGNTIRFSDQGPGIQEKSRALEFGTTSATEEMKRYIRGVGSGLPYVQQYLLDKGGSLSIEDNIHSGTIVTLSMEASPHPRPEVQPSENQTIPMAPPTHEVIGDDNTTTPILSAHERDAMTYLRTHESVGPSDLVRTYGLSQGTWSRTLSSLEETGLMIKVRQKRYLSDAGKAYLTRV